MNYQGSVFHRDRALQAHIIISRCEGCTCDPIGHHDGNGLTDLLHHPGCQWRSAPLIHWSTWS